MSDNQPIRVHIKYEDGRYSLVQWSGGEVSIPLFQWRNYLLHLQEDTKWQNWIRQLDSRRFEDASGSA